MSLLQEAVVAAARSTVADAGGSLGLAAAMDGVLAALDADESDSDELAEILVEGLRTEAGPLTKHGDLVVDVGLACEGLVLTHRLSEDEVAANSLDLDPDLSFLAWLADIDGGLHTPDGRRLLRRIRRDHGAGRAGGLLMTNQLAGPDGWLDGFVAGDLVAVRVDGGFVGIESADVSTFAALPEEHAKWLDALIDAANEADGSPVWIEQLLLGAIVDGWWDRSVVHAPFGDVLVASGLELDGHQVGRLGCWDHHVWVSRLIGALAHDSLSESAASSLLRALEALKKWRQNPATNLGSTVLARLHSDPDAAETFLEEMVRWDMAPADIAAFVTSAPRPKGDAAAVVDWLLSRAAAIDGRTDEAEQLARAAFESDPGLPLAVEEVAWYENDRGNARQVVNLLHRTRYPDDERLVSARQRASALAPDVGRNAPCPCGSGRKFKQCHLGRVELPAAERVWWLVDTARDFLARTAPPQLLDDAAFVHDDDGDGGPSLLAMDILLFDDGWLERFAGARGALLPVGDRELVSAWLGSTVLSMFRLVGVADDGRPTLSDMATGQDYIVEPSPDLEDADRDRLLVCRLVPVAGRWATTGVCRVAWLSERDAVLAAIADRSMARDARIAVVVGDVDDGPTMQNTAGDPLVFCQARLAISDEADLAAVDAILDETFDRDESGDPTWQLVGTTEDTFIEATVRRHDSRITVDTNSIARHEAALARLTSALPGLSVRSETRRPWARRQAREREEEVLDQVCRRFEEADLEEDDDEVEPSDDGRLEAALNEMRRVFDERWLDKSIPALGGLTPRQASKDAGRLDDLKTLLAEMDARLGDVNSDWLRSELDL